MDIAGKTSGGSTGLISRAGGAGDSTTGRASSLVLGAAALVVAMAVSTFAGHAQNADCKSSTGPETDWHDCNKRQLMLGGSDLQGSNLANTDFTLTDLRRAMLRSANLEKATLVRASLAGAVADKANFTRVEAYRGNFSGISAEGASFVSSELQRTDFTRARLTGADFEKAELGRADFTEAVLTGTKFSMANLSRANLSGAIFEGPIDFDRAFLFLTRIEGLDLSAATGLEQAQIDLACGDASTKLPAGLSAPAKWPCPADDD
ncbi:Secreted effector protein PipB [Ensifer psoraleae]|nr:Secreted effector protein PipB [Sinorhizobium psoraleae]